MQAFAKTSGSVLLAAAAAAVALGAALAGCGTETAQTPKPRAFPRVVYPEAGAPEAFAVAVCPFTFERPGYTAVERDTAFFDEAPKDPCWFDLVTPALSGRVHFSYYPVADAAGFESLRDDAFELAGKHNIVANYIDERPIDLPEHRVHGFAFDIEGDVASPFQFYVTDSARHFLRGALYVNARADADSLAPVYAFLRDDLLAAIESLRWRE